MQTSAECKNAKRCFNSPIVGILKNKKAILTTEKEPINEQTVQEGKAYVVMQGRRRAEGSPDMESKSGRGRLRMLTWSGPAMPGRSPNPV